MATLSLHYKGEATSEIDAWLVKVAGIMNANPEVQAILAVYERFHRDVRRYGSGVLRVGFGPDESAELSIENTE